MKLLIVFCMVLALFAEETATDEHPTVMNSSKPFNDSLASSVETLTRSGFADRLETPSLGASSNEEFRDLVQAISAETPIHEVSEGQRGVTYDVILQPGHYGRRSGATGTQGQLVSERALVAYITSSIAKTLRDSGSSVLVVSADRYLRRTPGTSTFDGLKTKVFLAIHADGNVHPCSTGPSLAYQSQSSLLAMHAIGWGLSAALGYSYSDFNKDNFTANEARYYMFKQVQADRLTGLLEIGELTCPASEKQLIQSANLIGVNLANGLRYIVQTSGARRSSAAQR